MLTEVKKELQKLTNKNKAVLLQRFFKTGKGEYAEGDIFIGLTVPQSRQVAKKFQDLPLDNIQKLLQSPIHEERLIALIILIHQFEKAGESEKKKLYEFYLAHTKYINNWDLVDCSAGYIVGNYLLDKNDRSILTTLATSKSLWDRRIAIVSTFAFLYKEDYEETLKIAELLVNDKHDLIHKAVGWLLREVGKRCSLAAEETFLKKHYKTMPRTMLRYAIERFPEEKRKKYLIGEM